MRASPIAAIRSAAPRSPATSAASTTAPGAPAATTPASRTASIASRCARSTLRATATTRPPRARGPSTRSRRRPHRFRPRRRYGRAERLVRASGDALGGPGHGLRVPARRRRLGRVRELLRPRETASTASTCARSTPRATATTARHAHVDGRHDRAQTSIGSGPDAATASRAAAFTYGGARSLRVPARRRRLGRLPCVRPASRTASTASRSGRRRRRQPDDSPATHTWTVDTIAPQTAIDSGPDAMTAARAASFTYGGGRDGTSAASTTTAGARARSYTDLAPASTASRSARSMPPATPTLSLPPTRGQSTSPRHDDLTGRPAPAAWRA